MRINRRGLFALIPGALLMKVLGYTPWKWKQGGVETFHGPAVFYNKFTYKSGYEELPNLSEVIAATLKNREKEFRENTFQPNPLLQMLKERTHD